MLSKNRNKPVTQADLNGAVETIGGGVNSLDKKIECEVNRLDKKIECEADRLDKKIECEADRLDKKIECEADRLDKKFAVEFVKVHEGMAAMLTKGDGAGLEKQLNHIITILDSLSGKTVDNRNTLLVYDKILGKHEEKLNGHEKRLAVLESRA